MKEDIRKYSIDELQLVIQEMGEKRFRAGQIQEWIWGKSAQSFDEMTSLSKELRERLKERFDILPIAISEFQKSGDGTFK